VRDAHEVAVVRAAEESLMAELPEGELMLRAAYGLATRCAEILAAAGGLYGARVVLLVGSGNNGGDALHAGAQLARRGAVVVAVLVGDRHHDGGARALVQAGGRLVVGDSPQALADVAAADLVVDGILGIGGRGGLQGAAARLADTSTQSAAVVVAVDVPSGVDADSGRVEGSAVWADVTVTFGTVKPGLLVSPGALCVGVLEVVDIGLRPHLPVSSVQALEAADVAQLVRPPGPTDHKYSRGVAGVCAGSGRYAGAAVLAAAGALYAGSGLVRVSSPVAGDVVRALPSCLASDSLPSQSGRADAWGVGPGLGLDDEAQGRLADVLAVEAPIVVDADGLTLLAHAWAAGTGPDLARRGGPTVLTPHAGEARRLAPDLDVTGDPLGAARQLAVRTGATVVLKGYTTVVAEPDGRALVNPTGTAWLAAGGTGDVLTGMVTSYLAAGLAPLEAAGAATFLHGLAGRLAADEAPVTAPEVAAAVPDAVRTVRTAWMEDSRA
jgi:hydroxyethylthiazole kinase-like uncharacterized protein yjeF